MSKRDDFLKALADVRQYLPAYHDVMRGKVSDPSGGTFDILERGLNKVIRTTCFNYMQLVMFSKSAASSVIAKFEEPQGFSNLQLLTLSAHKWGVDHSGKIFALRFGNVRTTSEVDAEELTNYGELLQTLIDDEPNLSADVVFANRKE